MGFSKVGLALLQPNQRIALVVPGMMAKAPKGDFFRISGFRASGLGLRVN